MELPSLNEFSLWLEPSGEDYERINSFASNLQKIAGSPNFVPHVTLLANIPLPQNEIGSLLKEFPPSKSFEIKFKNISTGDNPLKSLFLECFESPELMELNRTAQKIYGMELIYQPHMSLMYGNMDEKLKRELVEKIQTKDLGFFSFKAKKNLSGMLSAQLKSGKK